MLNYATFLGYFPEFTDQATYTQASFNFWSGVGARLVNQCRWGDLYDHGLALFTAHHMVITTQNVKDVQPGGLPGQFKGPKASKAVDKVNISYDTNAVIEENAGHWNLTTYGTQFVRLLRMMGSGGMTVGACGALTGVPLWPLPQ